MWKRIGFGVILWVIPYAAAVPLLPVMQTHPLFFKTLMITIASITAAVLAVIYFSKTEKAFLKEAAFLAVAWVLVNWGLDFVALLPFSHQTLSQYFMDIGLEYVAMMAPIIAIGYLLDLKTRAAN